MKTKSCVRVLLVLLFIFSFKVVYALQIKQINYSASNNDDRWFEVYNDGADINDFTLSAYKVIDSSDETKHSISLLDGSDNTFPSGTSVVISPSSNIPNLAEKVFRSPYKLNKTNGYIILKAGDDSYCLSYGTGSCDDISQNNSSNNSTSTNSTSTSYINSSSSNSENIIYIYVPMNNQDKYGDIQVLLPTEKVVPAAADVDYTLKVIDSQKNVLSNLNFHWSFGDGGEKFGKDVSYSYVYPGEYTLIAAADGYTSGGKAEMNVKVVEPNIIIKRVGLGEKDNVIDIENKTDYNLFLSGFGLKIDNKIYKLPKDFLIAKNKTIHISGAALGFKLPANSVSLLYPNGDFLIDYTYKNASSTELLNASNTKNLPTEEASQTNIILDTELVKNVPGSILNKNNNFKEKISENTDNNIKKEEIKDGGIKNKEIIVIKRLILENEIKSSENSTNIKTNYENKSNIVSKNTGVDTGLISWLKNLIY